jgi:hypothetical protein
MKQHIDQLWESCERKIQPMNAFSLVRIRIAMADSIEEMIALGHVSSYAGSSTIMRISRPKE